jgi:hypothetical protein
MRDEALDLETLLHPARAYAHPQDVVKDPDLTLYEKRAILASWASDACCVEAVPVLRQVSKNTPPVRFDDVMDALQLLDRPSDARPPGRTTKRSWRRSDSDSHGENHGSAA